MKSFLRKLITKARDGYAWWIGVYIIYFGLLVLTIMIKMYNISISNDKVEDVITMSSLGSLVYDKNEYSLTQNYVLCSVTKPGTYPDASYNLLVELLCKNMGLTTIDKYTFTGNSPYMANKPGYVPRIDQCIFYNVYTDENGNRFVKSYEYTNGHIYNTTTAPTIKTPANEEVLSTGVYLKFSYPVELSGNVHMVSKISFTALSE